MTLRPGAKCLGCLREDIELLASTGLQLIQHSHRRTDDVTGDLFMPS
jgi:hypothetical protein